VEPSDLSEFQKMKIPIPQSWVWRVPFDMSQVGYEQIILENNPMALRIFNSSPPIETISALISRGWRPSASYAAKLLDLYPPTVLRDTIYYMILHHNKNILEADILRKHGSTNAMCRLNAITELSKGPFNHTGIINATRLEHIHPMYVYKISNLNDMYGFNVVDVLNIAMYSAINPDTPATFFIGGTAFTLDPDQIRQVVRIVIELMQKCYPAYYSGYQTVMKGYEHELPMHPEWSIIDFASYYRIDEESIMPRLKSNNQFMALTRHIPILRKMEKDRTKTLETAVKEYLQE
jgi:hypothetical protein